VRERKRERRREIAREKIRERERERERERNDTVSRSYAFQMKDMTYMGWLQLVGSLKL